MRFILSTAAIAAASEDGTSLMQRRFIKQQQHKEGEKWWGEVVDWWNGLWEDDHEPVYTNENPPPAPAEHICGQWSDWSECSAACGGGFETRTYTFLDGASCGKSCPHGDGDKQQRECNTNPCAVDCEGKWGEYSECSATCGGGVQSRMFSVSQAAAHGGQACPVAHGTVEDAACSTQQCELNCKGHWEDWTECSNGGAGPHGLECGPGGSQSRTYTITQEATSGGCGCEAAKFADLATLVSVDASSTDTRECQLPCCPEKCEGEWGAWGQCEGPNVKSLGMVIPSYGYTGAGEMENCCGGGTKTRTYSVTKEKVCGGACCEASDGQLDSTSCCEAPCPVPCEGKWSDPGECCSSCGGGIMESVYIITQEAMYGGAECPHAAGDIKHDACNEDIPCPIDCEGKWSEWTQCTANCGPDGTQERHWIVTVEAEHGGAQCTELDQVQLRSCDPEPVPCPVPAVCTWTEYGVCSADCYDTQNPVEIIKTREWVEISPALYGGAECKESPPAYESAEAMCHQPNCPIDCIGSYGEYDECNAKWSTDQSTCAAKYKCGGGTHAKTYTITQPAMYGGEECPHEDGHKVSKLCGTTACPVDCEGGFTEWGDCCSDCGTGSQSRQYVITTPAKEDGCTCPFVEHVAHQTCNEHPCPIDCVGSWSEYTQCDQECTDCRNNQPPGKKTKTYTITVEAQYGGLECPHAHNEVSEATCNEHCCPEDCEGSWSDFGECSTTCGNGVTERTYTITHHEAHGGTPCPYCDKASHTTACNGTSPCAIDCVGFMSPWSPCTANCGGGERTAHFIHSVSAQNGGQQCEYGNFEMVTEACNTDPCPQMCLGTFGPWGACDAPCSGGTKSRSYFIYRPASGGGAECSHATGDIDTAACNEHDCPDGYVCPQERTCQYANGLVQRR